MDTGLEIHFLGTCLPAEVKQSTPSLCLQTRLPEFVPQTISCTKIIQNTKQLSCMAEWTPSMISAFQWCTLSPRHATGPPKTDPLVFRNMLEMISQYTVKKVPLPLWNLSHWFIGKKKKKKGWWKSEVYDYSFKYTVQNKEHLPPQGSGEISPFNMSKLTLVLDSMMLSLNVR